MTEIRRPTSGRDEGDGNDLVSGAVSIANALVRAASRRQKRVTPEPAASPARGAERMERGTRPGTQSTPGAPMPAATAPLERRLAALEERIGGSPIGPEAGAMPEQGNTPTVSPAPVGPEPFPFPFGSPNERPMAGPAVSAPRMRDVGPVTRAAPQGPGPSNAGTMAGVLGRDGRAIDPADTPQGDQPFDTRGVGARGQRFEWEPVVPQNLRRRVPSADPFSRELVPATETPTMLASRVTGAPYSYLVAVSGAEANDNPNIQNAEGSSALGAFQFTTDTWFQVMRDYGAQYGFPQEIIDQIVTKPSGQRTIEDQNLRARVLDLRRSPHWSAIMGGHLFQQATDTLERVTGRPVTLDEVYAAGHFLGEDFGGYVLREIDQGRGGRNAIQVVRHYYRDRPEFAEDVIRRNPVFREPGQTIAGVIATQRAHFRGAGDARGFDSSELQVMAGEARRAQAAENSQVYDIGTAETFYNRRRRSRRG